MKKLFASLFGSALVLTPLVSQATTLDIEDNLESIIYIECGSYEDDVWTPVVSGSGVAISRDFIVTNAHVVADLETYLYYDTCRGGYTSQAHIAPELTFLLNPLYAKYNDYFDYAFLEPVNEAGGIVNLPSYATLANADSMILNEYLYALGYPADGGGTITATEGAIAGFLGDIWIKSDVYIEHGSSGGGAFDEVGNLFGIPTFVVQGDLNSLSYLQNINAIIEDFALSVELFDSVERDYDTLYTRDNFFCLDGNCYNLAIDELDHPEIFGDVDEEVTEDDEIVAEDEPEDDDEEEPVEEEPIEEEPIEEEVADLTPPEAGRYKPERFDAGLQTRLRGNILLQVEEHGEAWYINPTDGIRYYMANGDIAYTLMRYFSLGITDADLAKIPSVADTTEMSTATSICSSNPLANRLKGYILLQVEQHGEAWYIDPDTCRRIYMKDGDVAYEIMRFLSLGIANLDLEKLPSGEITTP